MLGHASIKMTMDLYTHMLPDKKEEEMMKFAELQVAVMNMADETAEKSFEKAKEREKERTYSISYKTADNTTKTAEIIKAVDSTPYIRELAQQQITATESRIQDIIQQLNAPVPHEKETTEKAVYVADTKISRTMQYISRTLKKRKSGDSKKRQGENNV